MKKLSELISRLKSFEEGLFKVIENVIRNNEEIIIEYNTEDQLFEQGVTREGISISDYAPYSPITIELKRLKGQPTSRVTLRDEGDFHSSFYIDYFEGGFEIKARDEKTDKLKSQYGEEIMGLSDANFSDLLRNYVAPEIHKKLKQL